MHLAIIDTTGIQPYIFGSNALSENIGASYLVAQATGSWALECVRGVFASHNVTEGLEPGKQRTIEADNLDAEVLYAGGGNVLLLCRKKEEWEEFERDLSKKVLAEAPGIRLVSASVPCDLGNNVLRNRVNALFQELFEEKRARAPSLPLQGLGVTRACQSTGLPAVDLGDDGECYSAEVLAKQKAAHSAHQALAAKITAPPGFSYPKEFDNLGRSKGAQSYMAVVHADGNSMGQRIRAIGQDYSKPGLPPEQMREHNRRYIRDLRAFSEAVDEAGLDAQKTAINRIAGSVDRDRGIIRHAVALPNAGEREIARVELTRSSKGNNEWLLPFRPLVYGGDDLTFVCDGRLGISLALTYLKAFETETKHREDRCGEQITASAGIAIVKTHYPFARAYRLAEELASSAKQLRRAAQTVDRNWDASCLDWHFALGGLAGSIEQIRRRKYRTQSTRQPLTLRPVAVDKIPPHAPAPFPEPEAQRWEVVEKGIHAFQKPVWMARRNKLKRLREALRGGPAQVKAFTDAIEASPAGTILPDLPVPGDKDRLRREGWFGQRCAYFDAVELVDFFIPEGVFQIKSSDSNGAD